MKKTRKKLLATLALSCLLAVSFGAVAACEDKEKDGGLVVEFLEGYVDEISLGDSILIKDYIPEEILSYKDKKGGKGYTLQIVCGETVVDLTNRATYSPDVIGDWKLILTVGDEVKEITLEVKGRPLDWIYSKPENIEFTIDDLATGTLDLDAIMKGMKIEVYSDVEYETYIASVVVGTSNPVKTDIKGQTSYKFEKNDIHIFEFTTVAVDGQVVSDTFYAIPKTNELKQYAKKDATYPFRDWYKCTSANKSALKPDLATDGYYVDVVTFNADATVPDRDWAALKANAKLFKQYVDVGATEIKFDVYNPSANDNAYTLFHHLKEEKLPEGSKGTLKAGEWTTITVTKAMWEAAFAAEETDYNSLLSAGVYGWSKKSFSTASNFAFSIALHYQGSGGKAEFYLDNVRVYDSAAKETKVGLLTETAVGGDSALETAFYANSSKTIFGANFGEGASAPIQNADEAYVKEGATSWKWEIKGKNNEGTCSSLKFNFYYGGNANNLDQIFKDTTVESVSFDVYNAFSEDMNYEVGNKVHWNSHPFDACVQGTLTAGQWTTVTITRAAFDQMMADIASESKNNSNGHRAVFTVDLATQTTATYLYFDNIKINNIANAA